MKKVDIIKRVRSFLKGRKSDNIDIVELVGKVLLNKASQKDGIDLLKDSVDSLHDTLKSDECSLWYVNTNSHSHTPFLDNSISLIHRKLSNGCYYSFPKQTDYVHTLETGLFSKVISICQNNSDSEYVRCDRIKAEEYNYLSMDFLGHLDEIGRKQTDFIVIPIVSFLRDEHKKIIAILEFSFASPRYSDDQWERMSHLIRPFFSAAFNRYTMAITHDLMTSLANNQKESVDYTIEEISRKTMSLIKEKKYCWCEAASFFMWDTYNYRYNLVYTTAAIDYQIQKSIYFHRGEGLIGEVAANNDAKIINDVQSIVLESPFKWNEIKEPKTAMIIPIPRISSKDRNDVIGVIRLINKKNSNRDGIVDFFNDLDCDILQSITSFLALTIEYFIKEEEQRNFIDKLSHELMAPARAIRNDADRIIRKKNDKEFTSSSVFSYMEDVQILAERMLWQVRTNLYQVRDPNNRRNKYRVERVLLYQVVETAKNAVIPLAREKGVHFDNITYQEDTTLVNIDKDAFATVFYNLFTNAIKYKDSSRPFSIRVSWQSVENGLLINVEDNGIGIVESDKESIFHIGYRSIVASRIESGFGVGLTTVQQIIDDFGGTIEVTNLKRPTRFTIKIIKQSIL